MIKLEKVFLKVQISWNSCIISTRVYVVELLLRPEILKKGKKNLETDAAFVQTQIIGHTSNVTVTMFLVWVVGKRKKEKKKSNETL